MQKEQTCVGTAKQRGGGESRHRVHGCLTFWPWPAWRKREYASFGPKIWVDRVKKEEGTQEWEIVSEYLRKPCAARTLMLARSEMPERTKHSTLTQEAFCILKTLQTQSPGTEMQKYSVI